MLLDTKLKFDLHLKNVLDNVNKTTVNFKIPYLEIPYYLQIIRFHLDYGDIIYDRAYNTSFSQNIESVQCNVLLEIAGAFRGYSREKLYEKLSSESLQERSWYRNLCCLFKKINNQSLSYLSQLASHQTPGILDETQKRFLNLTKNTTFLKAYFPLQLKMSETI